MGWYQKRLGRRGTYYARSTVRDLKKEEAGETVGLQVVGPDPGGEQARTPAYITLYTTLTRQTSIRIAAVIGLLMHYRHYTVDRAVEVLGVSRRTVLRARKMMAEGVRGEGRFLMVPVSRIREVGLVAAVVETATRVTGIWSSTGLGELLGVSHQTILRARSGAKMDTKKCQNGQKRCQNGHAIDI